MIKPTIGRIVWYHPVGSIANEQPQAAMICYVWSDTCVNLAVFDVNGVASNKTSVLLVQPEMVRPSSNYCEWMPYQIEQANDQIDFQ